MRNNDSVVLLFPQGASCAEFLSTEEASLLVYHVPTLTGPVL